MQSGPLPVPAAAGLAGPPGAGSVSEQRRALLLARMRRRATGLLVAVAAIFGLATAFAGQAHWLSWVQAATAAGLVGGLADWFAVTALFRRPLGLPIPHTAIVVERKDRFAITLGEFVQESFLTPEAVSARLRASHALPRLATWLAEEGNAADLAGRVAHALSGAADLVGHEGGNEVIDALIRRRLDDVALAPLAGGVLEHLTRDGRHEALLDVTLKGLSDYLRRDGVSLNHRLGLQSPWWMPDAVGERLFGRVLAQSETVLDDMATNRRHPLRLQLEAGMARLAHDLQSDPAMRRRGEELKAQLLAQPTVREIAGAVWSDVRTQLASQAADSESELRTRLARTIAGAGRRLESDPELAETTLRGIESVAAVVLTNFEDELVALVTGTIERWDPTETSRRLELLLGPDLQYIRINGTVVGALAGLALHAISVAA